MRFRRKALVLLLALLAPGLVLLAALPAPAFANVLVSVDKGEQRMTVFVNGEALYDWPVSTGMRGHRTPSGSFRAFRMEEEHFSKEWDDAPMPNSIFFTPAGHAIHGSLATRRLGTPASHGCVRLSPEHAATLFALVREEGLLKTQVVIRGSESRLAAVPARRHLAPSRRDPAYDVYEGGPSDLDQRYLDPYGDVGPDDGAWN
jgi:L,D-transpeptidase catalytic domain